MTDPVNTSSALPAERPLRVGLAGYGFAGRTFHAPLIAATDGLELAAVSSRHPEKVAADFPDVPVVPTPEALFSDETLDLIVIATPNDTHAPLAQAALRSGKHVVVDKPFTLDLEEGRALIRTAEEEDRLLCVFHNRRWDSDYLSVRKALESGVLGEVRTFESRIDRFRPHVRDRWRERDVPGGGIWYDLGPHLIDQALQLFGLPDRVQASLATQRPGGLVEDWADVLLSYGERRVLLHASMLVAGGSPRFVVHGTAGSLVKQKPDQQEAQLLAGMTPGAPGWGEDADAPVFHDGTATSRELPVCKGDQRRFYAQLAAALRPGSQALPPVTPLEALAVMDVLETALRSAHEGRALPLTLTPGERAAWKKR
ncbi:oxidoreductase [Oecophyllibacter saccharovorans]|uniref:oxidoreductase n=1 Tax=Oecophyllibacter saccharovorans TaxID=2558360 RepID=UPI0018838B6E|nr:oxidoreductase [Oecophyllibacter saccharovorans]